MAGAFVAVADDATATFWNPAGLASGPVFDLVLERQEADKLSDRRKRPLAEPVRGVGGSSFGLAVGTPPLGLSYYRIRATSFPADPAEGGIGDREDIRSGLVTVRTLLAQNFGATFVQSLTPALVVGTTFRVVRGTGALQRVAAETSAGALAVAADLEGATTTTTDLDVGVLTVVGPWRFGLVGRNLRQPEFRVSTNGEFGAPVRISRETRAGIAFAPRARPAGLNGPLTVSADFDLERAETVFGERRDVAIGGEKWFGGRIAGRGGVRFNTLKQEGRRDPVVAAGFSLGPRRGSLVEGQITRSRNKLERGWGVSLRVTF